MLSGLDKQHALELLCRMPTEDVLALAETVSQRLVSNVSRQEALETIVKLSDSLKQLLRRKKVKREHLHHFLTDKKIGVSSTLDKLTLVRTVLQYWNCSAADSTSTTNGVLDSDIKMAQKEQQHPPMHGVTMSPTAPPLASTASALPPFSSYGDNQVAFPDVGLPVGGQMGINPFMGVEQACSSDFPLMAIANNAPPYALTAPPNLGTSWPVNQSPQVQSPALFQPQQPIIDTSQRVAEVFTPWFYSRLNGQNPSYGLQDRPSWGPQYFWPDANLAIYWLPKGNKRLYEGAEEVSRAFSSLIVHNRLHLEPNVCPHVSVRGQKGGELVLVSVSGVVFKLGCRLGCFEQSFGLLSDTNDTVTSATTWHIKHSQLKLMYSDESERPVDSD